MTAQSWRTAVPVAPGRIPGAGHVLSFLRRPVEFLQSLRAQGDMVKVDLGPIPVCVVNSPELIHRILVTEASHFEKGRLFDKARMAVGNGLALSDGAFHLSQRRLMQPAFHRERLGRYVEIMRERTEAMANEWTPGKVVAMDAQFNELALGIVSRSLFKSEIGQNAVATVLRSLPIAADGLATRTLLPIERLEKLPIPRNRRFDTAVRELRHVIDGVIATYRAHHVDHGDVLSMLLAARDEDTGEGMPPEQIRAEVMTIMLAGTETTGSTLAWLFYELDRHPSMLDSLCRELDDTLGDRPIAAEDISKLAYTRRLLTETLRLHAPNWILMRRAVREIDFDGVRIEPGTEIMFSIYAMHRDPALFEAPSTFDPERWLPHRPVPPRDAYIPFGGGLRKCIGDQFAMVEMSVVVATLARRWRLRLQPGRTVGTKVLATLRPSRLPMIVEARAAR